MKKHMMSGVLVLGMLLCLSGAPAQAQGVPKIDIFVGYSYLVNNINSLDPGIHGYALSGVYNFNRHIGFEAAVTGNHGNSITFQNIQPANHFSDIENVHQDVVTAVFGPKLTQPVGNFDLFAHFLVGVMHQREGGEDVEVCTGCTTSHFGGDATTFGMKVGGGVDWNHGRWGIRILELDFVHGAGEANFLCTGCGAGATNTGELSSPDVQLAAGVKFRFGGMTN